jgi:hypothetical protein
VRVISRTRCSGDSDHQVLATPDTWYFQSPSPYPLPGYREREESHGGQ